MADEQKPWEKYATASAEVPPWEKYGGTSAIVPAGSEKTGLPGIAKPPTPTGLTPQPDNFLTSPNGLIRSGARQAIGGIEHMAQPGRNAKYEGATDALKGAGSMLAPVAIGATIPSLAAAPAATLGGAALGAGGAYLGGKGARSLTSAAGGGPAAQELAEAGGNILGGAAGGFAGAKALPKAIDMIPNLERAGKNFGIVNAATKDAPVDLSAATVPALRAQELGSRGTTPPKVMNDFMNRITAPDSQPMLFPESRDFQSSAGRLSAAERMTTTPQMGSQVSGLAKALSEANEAVAEKSGVGDIYRSAMKEYRQAMQIQGAKEKAGDIAMQIAKKALIYGPGVGLGGYAANKIFNGVTK